MPDEDKKKTAFITPDGLYKLNVAHLRLSWSWSTVEDMSVLPRLHRCLFSYFLGADKSPACRPFLFVNCRSRMELAKVPFCVSANQSFRSRTICTRRFTRPCQEQSSGKISYTKDTEELRSFVGLCSYYRRFVWGFASIVAPLTALFPTMLYSVGRQSVLRCCFFFHLKTSLTSSTISRHYDPDVSLVAHVDDSGEGIAAVTAQRGVDGPMEHAVAYASRTLRKAARESLT